MSRIAYVNGQFGRLRAPLIHVEDRGYQFADGVYEVCLVVDRALWDAEGHFARWSRSLRELAIDEPIATRAIPLIARALLKRNRLTDALVYMQATRGVASRNHVFPTPTPAPTFVMTAKPFSLKQSDEIAKLGVKVITAPDIRWRRVDIKTVSLLPNVIAKDQARREGAVEAWLVRDEHVTEGSSSNAWIVTPEGRLVTHPLGTDILGGITRATVKACAEGLGMSVEERPFTIAEAMAAKEAFITSATNIVTPVVQIDDRTVANGAPGDVAGALREAYVQHCRRTASPV